MLSQSDKSKQIEESYSDLVKEAEKGNYFLVMTFLSSNSYSKEGIDTAFRKSLRNFPKEKEEQEEYMRCFRSFIEHIEDFNYRNDEEDNKTILMEVCWLGLKQVVDMIFRQIRESEGKLKIDLNVLDNTEENCMHKLICSPHFSNEDFKLEIFQQLVEVGVDINKENKLGYTPLAMALTTGNSKLSEELIKLGANKNHIVSSTGDSLLHSAILGKNPLCLSLLIDGSEMELKKHKNKKGELPVDLAAKMGLSKHIQLLGEQPILTSSKLLSMIQPLEEFRNGNYSEALRLLQEIKTSKEISLSLEWNILITEFMLQLTEQIKQNDNATNIMPNKENSFEKFKSYFKTLKSDNFSLPENSLLLYNLALFYFKLGKYKNTIQTLLDSEFLQKSLNHFEWILYVNAMFILLRIFIDLKQLKVVSVLLNNIEDFLNYTLKEKQKQTLKENITCYLNSKEVINQVSSLDESFCVLYLFKSYKFILENKSEEAKKNLKEYKRIFTNSKSKDQLPIFNTTKNMYHYLKIKIDYLNNSFFKCYKHLNSLYASTIAKQISNNESSLESHLFYLNAIGILNLRQKKYTLAQFFFKNCLVLLKRSTSTQPEWANYAAYVKYNIGLSLFHEKKFEKALRVFSTVVKNLNYYPFLLYRLGLCNLELEMAKERTESQNSYNEVLEKLIGYSTDKDKMIAEVKEKMGLNSLNNLSLSPIRSFDDTRKSEQGTAAFSTGGNVGSTTTSVQRMVLKNNSTGSKLNSKYLTDAIKHFKDTIILLKDNVYYKKEMSDVLNFYTENTFKGDSNNPTEIKSYTQIMISAYLNLIFSLILTEDWNEVLFHCDEFEKSPYYNKEVGYTIDNYKIEAYLALNQHVQILEILKKNMLNNNFSYNSLEFKGTFFNQVNKVLYPEINYKLALYINIIKMNFITNNLPEVEKGIISILGLLNINLSITNGVITQNDLPPFVLNLLIYYYLIKENYEVAINIIKKRKIPLFFAQNLQPPAQSKLNLHIK